MNRQEKEKQLEVAKECLLDELKEADEIVDDLLSIYDETAERLKADIQRSLIRFAENNEISIEEAKGLLSSQEFSKWKKSIKEYIQQIEQEGEGSKMLLELNTLSAKTSISRKEKLLAQIDKEMMTLAQKTNKSIRKHLGVVLVNNYYRGFYFVQKTVGFAFNVTKFNSKLVKQILEYPWSTKQFSKTIWDDMDKLTETLRKELASGFTDGSSIQKMVKRVDDVLHKGKFVTERIVRSEAKYFAQQGQLMSYKKLNIEEYMYRGAGCPKCKPLNGQVFKIEDAEVGVNCPPMHPNCKCRVIAVHSMSIFDTERNVVPLEENIKFQEWKERFIKNGNKAK